MELKAASAARIQRARATSAFVLSQSESVMLLAMKARRQSVRIIKNNNLNI